jgi:RHS repeat-associated protein
VASETVPNGRVTTYVYDDAGRLIQRIDNDVTGNPSGNEDVSTYFAYDAAGRQSAVRAPTANRTTLAVTRYFFDDQGQLITEIRNCTDSGTTPPGDPAWKTCAGNGTKDSATNLTTDYGYDDQGNRVAVIAPDPAAMTETSVATVTTRSAFDPDTNRLCGVLENATIALAAPDPCATDPGANGTAYQNVWTEYVYDGVGNLTSMSDGRGKVTTYEYDAGGRMTKLTDGLGNATTWTYDPLGRRTAQSARGTGSQPTLVAWTYDGAGRVLSRTADSATTSYTYDDNGNRLTAQTGSGPTITTTYDRLNRPLSVSVSDDSGAATTYAYSLAAPLWTDPSGSYTATLDKFDRQVDLGDPVNGQSHWVFTYRADGQPALVEAPNDNDTTFTYDAAGNLANKKTAKNNTRRVEYAWTRNRAGNLLSEDYTKATDAAIPAGFAYDGTGRLAAFTRDGATTLYGWQAVPNRDSTQYASDPAVTTTYNDANRPTSDSAGGSYSNNLEGQLTARPGQQLEWDSLGRLTAVWNAAHTTRLVAYSYDALDRLLIVDRGTTDQLRFRYVGLTTQVAQMVDHDASTVIRSIANDRGGERLFDWTGSGSNLRYYGTNGHRDVSWTATSTGTVDATLRYDPWGNLTSSAGSSLPEFRFQGSWFDTTTVLSWVVARWYAPALGRFISEDPLRGAPDAPSTRHRYAYAVGNPIERTDLSGLCISLDVEWCLPGPFWRKMRSTDSVWNLAERFLGSRGRWPGIFNRNRAAFQWPSSVPAGACIYIPSTTVYHTNECAGSASNITGLLDLDRRKQAARTLGINWWMLTEQSLETLTENRTNFVEYNVHPQAERLFGPTADALFLAWADGAEQVPTRSTRYAVYKGSDRSINVPFLGSVQLPFGIADATTIGAVIFVDKASGAGDPFLIGHEYIHVMQYAGTWNQEFIYLAECADMSICGKPSQPSESMAFLWTVWLGNYYSFGGPTHTLPQNKWHTPTLKQIWDAKPWYVWWPTWINWPGL